MNKTAPSLSKESERVLLDNEWKGNTRELKNIIERLLSCAMVMLLGRTPESGMEQYSARPGDELHCLKSRNLQSGTLKNPE